VFGCRSSIFGSQFPPPPFYVQTESGARTDSKVSKIRQYVLYLDNEALLSNSQAVLSRSDCGVSPSLPSWSLMSVSSCMGFSVNLHGRKG